ncbi:MAG: hypothetical protein WAT39_14150 [Planctomycetota bacterium]
MALLGLLLAACGGGGGGGGSTPPVTPTPTSKALVWGTGIWGTNEWSATAPARLEPDPTTTASPSSTAINPTENSR